MKHQLIAIAAFVLSVVVCVPARAQQEFSSESGTWTFTMPAGWQPMSKEMVAKINNRYKAENPEHPAKAVAGFIKAGGLFEYPRVVLQVFETNMSKLSWEALNRTLRDGYDESPAAEAAEIVAEFIDSNGAEDYDIRTPSRKVGTKGWVELENSTRLETASWAFFHSGGVVQLTGIDIQKDRPGSAQQVVDLFANSFHISQGHEFAAVPDVPPKPHATTTRSYSGGYRYGYYGGGGVVVVILVILRIVLRGWVNRD